MQSQEWTVCTVNPNGCLGALGTSAVSAFEKRGAVRLESRDSHLSLIASSAIWVKHRVVPSVPIYNDVTETCFTFFSRAQAELVLIDMKVSKEY